MKKIYLYILLLFLILPNICFAKINIFGSDDKNKIKIVENYEIFYKDDINIYISEEFPTESEYERLGVTYYLSNNKRYIFMKEYGYDKYDSGYTFEFVLNHELCHYYFINHTEEMCDKFSENMIKFVKSL